MAGNRCTKHAPEQPEPASASSLPFRVASNRRECSRSALRSRHVWRGPRGNEMAMHGVYREVVPPERIVRTESFDFGCDAQSK